MLLWVDNISTLRDFYTLQKFENLETGIDIYQKKMFGNQLLCFIFIQSLCIPKIFIRHQAISSRVLLKMKFQSLILNKSIRDILKSWLIVLLVQLSLLVHTCTLTSV